VLAAWKVVYTGHHRYSNAYRLGETLVDVEYDFQIWRFKHFKTVERIIGSKPGTGGSSGVGYLKLAIDRYFYPELWELRNHL
jgi:tryptophan 2,3-dioxygenase